MIYGAHFPVKSPRTLQQMVPHFSPATYCTEKNIVGPTNLLNKLARKKETNTVREEQ